MGLLKAHRSIDCSPGRELFPATGLSTGACKEGDAERGGHDDLGQILPLVALLVAMALGLAILTVETVRLVGERAVAQLAATTALT